MKNCRNGMQWRQVGPFRGGRALAIEGVSGEPASIISGRRRRRLENNRWRRELDADFR